MNFIRKRLREWKIGLLIHEFLFQIPYIVYFNLRYLPWHQARRFPIWLHVRTLSAPKGKIIIDSENIRPGMIILGPKQYFQYKSGISIWNEGTIIFKGSCWISNETSFSIGKKAELIIGEDTGISTSKIMCAKCIEIGSHVMVGFSSVIMDSDFHPIIDIIGEVYINPTQPVKIGDYNWLGAETMVMKGTRTPKHVIIAARSILNRKYKIPPCCCLSTVGGKEIISEGYIRDWKNLFENYKTRKIENIQEVLEQLNYYNV